MSALHRAAWPALGAAFLFGASTPFAKKLMGDEAFGSSPFLLAGLLYFGSGIGLTLVACCVIKAGGPVACRAMSGPGFWVRLPLVACWGHFY